MEARELQSPDVVVPKETSERTMLNSKEIYHDQHWYWVGRRTQDIILSLCALLVLWPFMLLIALIVWIDSPGASPIFTQTRVGRKGGPFQFRNLRWMKS